MPLLYASGAGSARHDVFFGGVAGGGGVGVGVLDGVEPDGVVPVPLPGARPKSTVGGRLTAPSSATVKLGRTGMWNSIAVRFVGNERTVVLYSWTERM